MRQPTGQRQANSPKNVRMIKISSIKVQSIPSKKKKKKKKKVQSIAQAHEEIRKKRKDFIPTESAGFP